MKFALICVFLAVFALESSAKRPGDGCEIGWKKVLIEILPLHSGFYP